MALDRPPSEPFHVRRRKRMEKEHMEREVADYGRDMRCPECQAPLFWHKTGPDPQLLKTQTALSPATHTTGCDLDQQTIVRRSQLKTIKPVEAHGPAESVRAEGPGPADAPPSHEMGDGPERG